ncbi:response regulator [Marinobacterium arenosum]|uniref:response regulator n=1 Tax=Marinobacterium arenosum TaxID=2862496 RepID=UPI001C95AD4E|nr:response regulator transcription factor [Marinobacterium arenosum]MBY4677065.1 response regulator transcription factor [Marinobacterium arenosum]
MCNRKQIIVVDDDLEIRELLTRYLENNRFQVTALERGEALIQLLQQGQSADLVVLDIMLPGADGFEICRQLRTFSQVPVIMLTANSDEMDRVVGLELGADDYLAKPFNPRELLARIRAILRRTEAAPPSGSEGARRYCRFAGFELDTANRRLRDADGAIVSLSGADYNLLTLFLGRVGEILSRELIAEQTRGRDNLPMDRFVDVHVSRLRQRLGDDARRPTLIKTVRGKGYVLTSTLEQSDESIFPA